MSPRKTRIPSMPSSLELAFYKLLTLMHEGHAIRVRHLTVRVCREMGMTDRAELETVERGAGVHDIGKVGVPDAILLRPGPLDPHERKVMQRHPGWGYSICRNVPALRKDWRIPYCHHEWWNGKGYPRKLKGDRIPLEARAFAVIDVHDALSEDRPYRKALPPSEVWRLLDAGRGTQFDPRALDAFRKVWEDEEARRHGGH